MLSLAALALLPLFGPAVCGVERAAAPGPSIARLIAALDHPDYDYRRRAQEKLQEVAREKDLQPLLAEQIQRVLVKQGVSYEVRSVLVELRRMLPAAETLAPTDVGQAEIDRLLDELDNDSFAQRVGAAERLNWLLGSPAAGVRMMTTLKARLQVDLDDEEAEAERPGTEPAAGDADERPAAGEDRHPLVALLHEVRGRWLTSPTEWPLPAVEETRWRGWIQDLASERDDQDARIRRAVASRELRDLLARQQYTQPVTEALQKNRDETGALPGALAIERLLAWVQPAMVAEVWQDHRHVTIQYLIVGVPQFPEGAWRATHFDRIDDHTAHCVSGNNLEPGDYPVGQAIPHPHGHYFMAPPSGLNLMFHLINLPTPRQRMAYKYLARRPQADRLRELSQRTMDAIVAEKRRPTPGGLSMLAQIDAEVLSRSIGAYFDAVPDHSLNQIDRYPAALRTDHEALCELLADVGTHDALPALEKEARRASS